MTGARLEGSCGPDPRTARHRTLPQLLRDRAGEVGGQVAMRRKRRGVWQPTRWAAMYATVRALAQGLRSLGIGAGDGAMAETR